MKKYYCWIETGITVKQHKQFLEGIPEYEDENWFSSKKKAVEWLKSFDSKHAELVKKIGSIVDKCFLLTEYYFITR